MGETVRKHRQSLGITQEELAWRADMHRTYLADIERGVRNITLRSVSNLAKALQVTVMSLLFRSGESDDLLEMQQRGRGAVTILLVEDDPLDVELTLRAFRKVKFTNQIDVVRDGKEALDYLFGTDGQEKRKVVLPNLVLLDLGLPKVSGLEVLRAMKASPETADIPVVVLTMAQDDSNIIVCSKMGASLYIIKPVDLEDFARVTSQMDFRWTLNREPAAKATTAAP